MDAVGPLRAQRDVLDAEIEENRFDSGRILQMALFKYNYKNEFRDVMYAKKLRAHSLMNGGKRHETTGCFEGQCAVYGIERRLD